MIVNKSKQRKISVIKRHGRVDILPDGRVTTATQTTPEMTATFDRDERSLKMQDRTMTDEVCVRLVCVKPRDWNKNSVAITFC